MLKAPMINIIVKSGWNPQWLWPIKKINKEKYMYMYPMMIVENVSDYRNLCLLRLTFHIFTFGVFTFGTIYGNNNLLCFFFFLSCVHIKCRERERKKLCWISFQAWNFFSSCFGMKCLVTWTRFITKWRKKEGEMMNN